MAPSYEAAVEEETPNRPCSCSPLTATRQKTHKQNSPDVGNLQWGVSSALGPGCLAAGRVRVGGGAAHAGYHTSAERGSLCTFHSDFFDLLGFLVDPFFPADFLSRTHQLLEFLDLLFGIECQTSGTKGKATKLLRNSFPH